MRPAFVIVAVGLRVPGSRDDPAIDAEALEGVVGGAREGTPVRPSVQGLLGSGNAVFPVLDSSERGDEARVW